VFDRVVTSYQLEKVKTVGDAYMFAGGVPELSEGHVKRMVEACLQMRDFIDTMKNNSAENEIVFEIRLGIHIGPVVAGVVGIKKFSFDIWGDTVNVAARMEQNGERGKVNVSQSIYEILKDEYDFEHRGKVSAKNKGDIDMYFVEDKA
jgi:class 3 adenylate cyclase